MMFRAVTRSFPSYRVCISWTLGIVAVAAAAALVAVAHGETFYIGPSGSNGNSGTSDGSPWGTFNFAINQLGAGDTLYVLGGTYNIGSKIDIDFGGTSGSPISMLAYQDEIPILDFSAQSENDSNRGIEMSGGADWWRIKGLTIQNAGDNGLYTEGDNGIFERLILRENRDSGFQLHGSASNNLILNSDSYLNFDPGNNGENADGFAVKDEDIGPGNIFIGNRAWSNSDDGWDTYRAEANGVLIMDSWSFDNGVLLQSFIDQDPGLNAGNFEGDGTGYKLGKPGGTHVLANLLAVDNASNGVDINENGNGVEVYNTTSFSNNRNWQFDADTATHILKNNISYAGSSSDNFDSVDPASETNSWDPGFFASGSDFLSISRMVGMTDLLLQPRLPDGSLPDLGNFLKLNPSSDLVDTGTVISFVFNGQVYNLPYNGSAPDLGAFETGGAPVTDDFWANASNGTWSTGSNWVDGSTPTDANTANFDESGSYIVTFNATPDSIRELNVSDGTITFQSSGGIRTLAVDSASGSQDVTISGGASLTLGTSGNQLDLTVGNNLSIVGASSSLTVRFGSDLNVNGDVLIDEGSLQIGFPFESVGQFNLTAGSTVTIEDGGLLGFVGTYTTSSNAVYNVTGSGSEFSMALGNLSINNGAVVNVSSGGFAGNLSGSLSIGTTGDGGALNVQGSGSTASATASVTIGQTSGSPAALIVGTTDSGAEFTTGTGTTTVLATGDVYVGSSSTTGTFNANGDVHLDAGWLHIRELGTFNLAAGKRLIAEDFGAITFKDSGYSAPADTDYELSSGGEIFAEGDLEFGTAGNNTVTLDLGDVTAEGTITIGPDAQIVGQGNVDSPNSPLTPTIVQGSVIGNSPSERISMAGYVTGTGTLDNVLIIGTHAPGASTAAVNVGDVLYGDTSTLEIELGGTGSGQFDQVNSTSAIELQSSTVTLDVSLFGGYTPEEGHSFDILTAVGGITGQFAPPSLPALGGDLEWYVLYDTNLVSLFVTLPGDFNGDGVTDAADYTVWRDSLGDFVAKGDGADADFDGEITENDYMLWRANFGATAPPPGSGSAANAAVPEPATGILLIFGCIAIFGRYRPNFLASTK